MPLKTKPSSKRVARRFQAAPASSLDPRKVYYHGTPSERAGKSILRSGIEPPDLTTRKEEAFRPVAGKVYLTPHLSYAILYALGGPLAEAFLQGREGNERLWGASEWGYVFEVSGKSLTKVHPDEDSVGEMLADGTAPGWLRTMAQLHLSGMKPEVQPNAPDTFYLPNFFNAGEWEELREESVYDLAVGGGFFSLKAQAVAGKVLLSEMTPQQELELISLGAHVAHEGRVFPSACWRIHKAEAGKLKRDGSNFFQVAERCR